MTRERRLRIVERLVGTDGAKVGTARLCDVCAETVEVDGAGLMLMSGDIQRGPVCTTDDVSARIEALQFDLGEGPCLDAYNDDRPVLEPDLADPENVRWPAFTGPAVEAGVGAVFGFPMQVGSVRLGALNLYREKAGPLTDDQHEDALVMAGVAAQTLLMLQADALPGAMAAELTAGADFQYVVHQASGMVAAQLDVSVAQALVRLRGHAFGDGRTVREVSEDVVERRFRFELDDLDKS